MIGVQKDLEIESTQQRNAGRQLESIAGRRSRLEQEQGRLGIPDAARLAQLRDEVDGLAARLADRRSEVEIAESALPGLQSARASAHETRDRENREGAQIDARLSALKGLQERVQTDGKLKPWLARHGLERLPRLWQRLQVEPGWEPAIEATLRERVGALEVGQLDRVAAFFDDLPPAKLAFFAEAGERPVTERSSAGSLRNLVDVIAIRDPGLRGVLAEWLRDVYTADAVGDALARRASLPPGACFVLRTGHLIGRDSIQLYAADSEQAGLLARQHEIEDLTKRSRAQALIAEDARAQAVRADAAITQATTALATMRQAVTALTAEAHGRQLALQKMQQDEAQSRSRNERIAEELAHLAAEEARERAASEAAELNFERLDQTLADVQARVENAQTAAREARVRLDAARQRHAELQRTAQAAHYERKAVETRIADLERQATLASDQSLRIEGEHETVAAELAGLSDEAARAGLQDALSARAASEARLADARAELDALAGRIRGADESRLTIERELDPLRVRIGEAQLKQQAARMTRQQFDDQLAEASADREALTRVLDGDEGRGLRVGPLQTEVQKLQQTIASLGAVNLAALDELATARERKTFLDAQTTDLDEAITTLEDAIRKIDRETRALLQETFDAINLHFGKLFPALFGGGEARLVMTGDEILDAGVQVMAQPPGKKNSSIHLLSGGEKALTATALVFAMFQLNPAPFCLLDEVDAPLDDANTERFCNLVKTMSAHTQFLFISHNKVAMEMAQQLIGVTMQEQGVSRIVAVDLESAFGFANERLEEAA